MCSLGNFEFLCFHGVCHPDCLIILQKYHWINVGFFLFRYIHLCSAYRKVMTIVSLCTLCTCFPLIYVITISILYANSVLQSKQICNYVLIIIFFLVLSSQIYVVLQVNAVTSNLAMREDPLPQDLQEGVDSDEWSDED